MRALRTHCLALIMLAGLCAAAPGQDIVRIVPENPTDCAKPCNRIAVIFVHGLTGAQSTWQHANGAYWPALLAGDPQLGAKLDIYRVDYDSFFLRAGPDAEDVLVGLTEKLDALLFRQKQYGKIVLICHSLGGILCRRYLAQVKGRYSHKYLSMFGVVVTLGTPMKGAELQKFAHIASNNQQLRVLRPLPVNDYLKFLINFAQGWDDKRGNDCTTMRYLAGYEERPLPMLGIVVPEDSAIALSSEPRGFDKDHVEIAKPESRADPLYVWVHQALKECDAGQYTCTPPSQECPGRMPPWLGQPR